VVVVDTEDLGPVLGTGDLIRALSADGAPSALFRKKTVVILDGDTVASLEPNRSAGSVGGRRRSIPGGVAGLAIVEHA
jgi:hypothetical protein